MRGDGQSGISGPVLFRWFADAADRHPDVTAVECGPYQLTYRELRHASECLAGEILQLAGRPPAVVGLHANRTLSAYVGYLAAQRLGSVVVPLHPAWPKARTEELIRLAQVDLVLSAIPELAVAPPVLEMDDTRLARPDATPTQLPPLRDAPDDVAYVLFTSGSTGVPKGVPIRQRNIAAYLSQVIARYELGPGSRTTQTFDLTFDLSMFDVFASLGSGATLVVPRRRDLLAPPAYVERERITHWFSVPSVITTAMHLGVLTAGSMPTLRWSLFCGEQLTLKQARWWQLAAPNSAVENVYGPTELTLSCTQYRLPEADAAWPETSNATVPIGSIYPGHEAILVSDGKRVADLGELCVRGPQRFDGYLEPLNNRDRFVRCDGESAVVVDDPGQPAPDLWYRTGDLVRQDAEFLVHLGRIDDQVKVQGYRIELGEVEAAIGEVHGVVAAAAVVATDDQGQHVLRAAYCGGDLAPEALRRSLRAKLPAHLVPDAVTRLDQLPLNLNGKVDRSRLAAMLGGA